MRIILVAIANKIAQWILKLGLEAIARALIDFIEEQKKKKINEENEKSYKKALDEKNAEERKKAARKLLNGEK